MVTKSTSTELPTPAQTKESGSNKLLIHTNNPLNAYRVDESLMRFDDFVKEIEERQAEDGKNDETFRLLNPAILFGDESRIICWYEDGRLAPINEHRFSLTGKIYSIRHDSVKVITIEAIKEGARRFRSNPETRTLFDDLYIKLEYRKSRRPVAKIGARDNLETEQ